MTGKYEHSMDEKGRLFIPSKFRETLGAVFYLAPGVKENLTIYPQAAWDVLRDRVAALTTTQAAAMDVFFASSYKCEPDKQWRVLIPADLREYAKLERDVVITGNNDRAQIWSAESWREKARQELTP
ncbi:MAG: division/cell wall cluster transcriptional repressor MraZ, partial [Clostridiales bacterium]|nr:division/cell wall cluster transcriptional repressor MraZ [Clostridiales bacterium]